MREVTVMVANKHFSKIIVAVMAIAVVMCFLAIAFSGQLTEAMGGTGVKMEYESKLFNTDFFFGAAFTGAASFS